MSTSEHAAGATVRRRAGTVLVALALANVLGLGLLLLAWPRSAAVDKAKEVAATTADVVADGLEARANVVVPQEPAAGNETP